MKDNHKKILKKYIKVDEPFGSEEAFNISASDFRKQAMVRICPKTNCLNKVWAIAKDSSTLSQSFWSMQSL